MILHDLLHKKYTRKVRNKILINKIGVKGGIKGALFKI